MGYNDGPDVELTGEMIGPRGGAWHFIPDFLPDPIFIPKSQCTVEYEEPGSTRCTVYVRAWLAKRENWVP